MYTKDSLDTLKNRIDLIEVLSGHLDLKRAGVSFKACCPFHEEKTPSFVTKRGESHYHCFGCGAHGDAIAFLMSHLKMGFAEAVEHLAEKFQVVLERADRSVQRGPKKAELKEALDLACRFYHFLLLRSEEGHRALQYLFKRGLSLSFIGNFQIGLAPKGRHILAKFMQEENIKGEVLQEAGLIRMSDEGRQSDFFSDRIVFPIRDAVGAVVGFSGRKYREETPGGKYVNTPETILFKKSHLLFGLSYCRKRIAKERRAIIVEGQIDALRLIDVGFDLTVAGQGTAFGEGHVQELIHLGVKQIYLALDADTAGQEAAVKIGHLFQKKGVGASVISLPLGSDPDTFLRDRGPEAFARLLEESTDYLTFAFRHASRAVDLSSPAAKTDLVETLAARVRDWDHPVMVHESLRRLAELARVPEETIRVGEPLARASIKRRAFLRGVGLDVDSHRILEIDLLRWAILVGLHQPEIMDLIKRNVSPDIMQIPSCRKLLAICFEASSPDLFSLASAIDEKEDPHLMAEVMQKRVNLKKAKEGCITTVTSILQRAWLEETEEIKRKIHSGTLSDEEAMELAKRFAFIKKHPPQVKLEV